ncbi:MAG TPA: glycerol-3-phosphate dehydrogenase/oxidase [Ornithinibacter sp.]|nr:glycerol-3-phosphate dehydrogenase/oxidase [Ornithinibacter sp.]
MGTTHRSHGSLRGSSSITAATRASALQALADIRYDVIVVGGGITGAGVALDAASRGLRTALVERVDLAAGTSRWSSKLVHGGLRYLVKGHLRIAWESARERHALMTAIAPHLVRPVPNLLPLHETSSRPLEVASTLTVRAADLLRAAAGTPRALLPRPSRLDATATLAHAPGIGRAGLRGAVLYWDGQVEDDARLVTMVARTAAAHGVDVVTRCSAVALGEDHAELRDELTGESLTARGWVVNATGVWSGTHEPSITIVPSRGSHLIVRSRAISGLRAVVNVPVPDHFGRYVLAAPLADDLVLIGPTDSLAPGVDGLAPRVPPEDEAFILRTINAALERPLTAADVVGRFAGVRPLVTDRATGESPDISRRHLLLTRPGHPITIAGGKLTTYRQMAEEAVDAVGIRVGAVPPSRTASLPLVGAAAPHLLALLPEETRLVRRYGTEATAVAALAAAHPDLAGPVSEHCRTTGAEMLFGVLHEGALCVEDLIERRTRVSFVESAVPSARAVAERALERASECS